MELAALEQDIPYSCHIAESLRDCVFKGYQREGVDEAEDASD
jgi:hypothetical protein